MTIVVGSVSLCVCVVYVRACLCVCCSNLQDNDKPKFNAKYAFDVSNHTIQNNDIVIEVLQDEKKYTEPLLGSITIPLATIAVCGAGRHVLVMWACVCAWWCAFVCLKMRCE